MLKELICAVALTGTIGATTPQNSNDGTYYQDVTITESYEYQTNEVNSVDDLVVGNIYKFTEESQYTNMKVSKIFNVSMDTFIIDYLQTNYDDNNYVLVQNTYIQLWQNGSAFQSYYSANYSGAYFIYVGNTNGYIENIAASDFLGEKTITITPKEFNGLFNIFDNFLHERLFSGGILDTTNVTVFNATLSLGQWLSTTTSIVLLSLIVLMLVLLIKFIFKYVGGMMIWRS